MKIQKTYYLVLMLFVCTLSFGQQPKVHSHNDYEQKVPFWTAFSAGLTSIEVDVFLKNGQLYATHSENDIIADRTIENLYLKPLQEVLTLHLGEQKHIQLLIDVKSDAYKTLDVLVTTLKKYPDLISKGKLTFVISGNEPQPSEYQNYPDFIRFDYQSLKAIPVEAWKKVAMISLDYHRFSEWNGKDELSSKDKNKLKAAITKAHSYHKPFRFWATPDTKTAWKFFTGIGIDFVNTDHPFACELYIKSIAE